MAEGTLDLREMLEEVCFIKHPPMTLSQKATDWASDGRAEYF